MNIAEIKGKAEYMGTNGNSITEKKRQPGEESGQSSFSLIMDNLRTAQNSANIISQNTNNSAFGDTRLPGDYISSFKLQNPGKADYERTAQGMASDFGKSGNMVIQKNEIDKTGELYEKALELESYFVKIMLDSMRKTLSGKTLSGDESFAGKMYNDMMYEELGRNVTKNAGFGLADQIYLELYRKK